MGQGDVGAQRETSEVSVQVDDLRQFFESGQRYVTTLEGIFETVASFRSTTVGAIGQAETPPATVATSGYGGPNDAMAELIAEARINNGFVETIYESLATPTTVGGANVAGGGSIDQALWAAGLGQVGADAALQQDQALAALLDTPEPDEVMARLTAQQQEELDAYERLLHSPGGQAVPVRVHAIDDQDVRLLVAEMIIDKAIADSRDTNRSVHLGYGHEPWRGVDTLVTDVGGTELQPYVAQRLVEEGVALEAELGHVAVGPSDAAGRARQNQQETAMVLVTLGLGSMSEQQLTGIVGGLDADRAELIVAVLDLDNNESNGTGPYGGGVAPVALGERQAALTSLLQVAVDPNGRLRPGGQGLFEASIDQLQVSGWSPGLPSVDGRGTSGNDLRVALVAIAEAPNFGLTNEEFENALEVDRLFSALPDTPTDQQWRELDMALAALGDQDTIDFVLASMMADLPAAEALRVSRSAAGRPRGPYNYGFDYSPTDTRVDVLRLLLGTDPMGNPPQQEAILAGGLPEGAGASLVSELRILQALQMNRWNAGRSVEATPPLSANQLELVADFEARLGDVDRLTQTLWDQQLGGVTPVWGQYLPPRPTQHQTLEAIVAGALEADAELVALANRLTATSANEVWSILLAAPNNTKFLNPDGSFGGYDRELNTNLLHIPGYEVSQDNFTSLSVQLLLQNELAPTAPLLDGNRDGLITENDRDAWLANNGRDIPPILRDRIQFGAGFGLGHDDWGWDELAEGLGVLGLAAAVVVTVVYSGGAAAPLWVKGGLVTLAGAEFIAASQAGDQLGAGLALFGGAADGVAFLRLLGRGGRVTTGSIVGLADNPSAWDEISDVDQARAYDQLVAEARGSDIPALQALAEQSDELSPAEFVSHYRDTVSAYSAEYLADIHDPVLRAIARRSLADAGGVHIQPRWVTGGPPVSAAEVENFLSADALAEARSWSMTDAQIAEAIGAGAHTPQHFDHIGRGLHTGEVKPYELQPLQPQYVGEQYGKSPAFGPAEVTYLSETERQMLRVEIRDGKLYDASGQPVDTASGFSAHSGDGNAIFVMGPDGHLYVSNHHEVERFHHSSVLAGEPVAGAGEIVVEDGVIVSINRGSGHYRPNELHMDQVLEELDSAGIDVAGIETGGFR